MRVYVCGRMCGFVRVQFKEESIYITLRLCTYCIVDETFIHVCVHARVHVRVCVCVGERVRER